MRRLHNVWWHTHLSLSTKLRLYHTLVVRVLFYASKTWTITVADLARLQAFHMSCQRQILNMRMAGPCP